MIERTLLALAAAAGISSCGNSDRVGTADPAASAPAASVAASTSSSSNTATAARNIAKALAMPEPQPVGIDPCTLVTAEEAGAVLDGLEETKTRGGESSRPFRECFHTGGTMGIDSVLVAVAGGLDAEQFDAYVQGNAELTGDEADLRTIDGLGDKAYWHRNFLWVHEGPTTFYVSVSARDRREDAASLESAKEFAARVLTRL